MFESKSVYVFLEANVVKKEKNNTMQVYRFLKVADPQTYENFILPFGEHLNLSQFKKGEKVKLIGSLVNSYGRSQFLIEDVVKL